MVDKICGMLRLLLLFTLIYSLVSAEKVGRVTSLFSDVVVKRAKINEQVSAHTDMEIEKGDVIITAPGASAEIKIEDGIIRIRENTKLFVSDLTVFKLWIGRLWMSIDRLKKEEYCVVTPTSAMRLSSGEFGVGVGLDDTTHLFVFEGAVYVRGFGREKEVKVSRREKTVIRTEREPLLPSLITEEEEREWRGLLKEPVKVEKREMTKEREPKGKHLFLSAEYGACIIDDKLWYRLGILPEMKRRRFSFGLDLSILLDANGRIREEDWRGWQAVAKRVRYIQYGDKEKSFLRVGGISDVTFGSGFIVNRYTNLLDHPSTKTIGLVFSAKRGSFSAEGFVSDLSDPHLYGIRVCLQPASKLTAGITYVTDTEGAETSVGGIDLSFSILPNMSIYTETAYIKDCGMGFVLPGISIRFKNMRLKAEYRMVDSDFVPSYFDTFYHHKGVDKRAELKNRRRSGVFSEISAFYGKTVFLLTSFENYSSSEPSLYSSIKIVRPIYKVREAELSFSQTDVKKVFERSPTTLWQTKLGIAISPLVDLKVGYKLTYDEEGRSISSPSVATRIRF
jgi:hypothetical protein